MAQTTNTVAKANDGEEVELVFAPSAQVSWKKKEDESVIFEELKKNNQVLASRVSCVSIHNKKNLACNCLCAMKDKPEFCQAVAEFQMCYHKKKK
jgi:hypothetical protein